MSFVDESKHLNSYIHRILEIIKTEDRGFSYKEINDKLGMHITSNPKLINLLRMNSKILLYKDTIKFVPQYNLRSEEDLLDVVKECHGREGIEVAKLLDSPVNIRPYIEALVAKERIIILKDLDGSEIAFYNDKVCESAPIKLKEMWNSIKVPNYNDMVEELKRVGMGDSGAHTIKKKMVVRKAQQRKKRRVKITNTHVEGLDLANLERSE